MKIVLITVFIFMILASIFTFFLSEEKVSDIPVLYWVTDGNPARQQQISEFYKWLENNYSQELKEKYGFSRFVLKTDQANRRPEKIVIHGISGVASDIIDVWSGTGVHRYFDDIGLLADISEQAVNLGFDLSKTYKAISTEIVSDNFSEEKKQIMFPCNVVVSLFLVNKNTFAKYGLAVPPRVWDTETFEKIGKQFVKAANTGKEYQEIFFTNDCAGHLIRIINRSKGLGVFNETMTASVLNDKRNIETLRLVQKWLLDDRIIPTLQERQSFSAQSGFSGSASASLFFRGRFAMFYTGRYGLIQLRQYEEPIEFSVSEPPHCGFKNAIIATRAAGIYAGSKKKYLAKYFLSYLASKEYNMQIVKDTDGLPPNPIYTETEEYLHPAEFPNEWEVHEAYAEAAENLAVPYDYSPFVSGRKLYQINKEVIESLSSRSSTPEQIAAKAHEQLNDEIKQTLEEKPFLVDEYDKQLEIQKEIEKLLQQGQKIPKRLISNPFYLRYYEHKGWLE